MQLDMKCNSKKGTVKFTYPTVPNYMQTQIYCARQVTSQIGLTLQV